VRDALDLREALRRTMGYSDFRPGQEALIRAVLGGRDAIGVLPTGGGKSVCFQLPGFLQSGMVLVVSPLISLMEDQVARARKAGLRADLLNSATPAGERGVVLRRAARGRSDLLLVAPERFLVPSFREILPRLPVSLLAVDEAHCISQWGHDFRPAYRKIGGVRVDLSAPVLALTATATPRVREEIEASLRLDRPLRVVGSFDRPNLSWEVERASGHREKIWAIRRLLGGRRGATIVYASTRRAVEAVRRDLASRGIPAISYHAGLSSRRRSEVQGRFLADPSPVIVATNAFGMGIDRPDVRMVLHHQLPGSLEAYYQEAGRAGRDGGPARCVALWGPRDRRVHDLFVAAAHPGAGDLRTLLRWIRRSLPRNTPVAVDSSELAKVLGCRDGEEGVLAALRALARAGAVTLDGDCLTVIDPDPDLRSLAELRRISSAQVSAAEDYARGTSCRRRSLLRYFGEDRERGSCGRCDRCPAPELGPLRRALRTARGLLGIGGSQ
jgi:ATP-dependent DNA helicase RecQ